MGIQAKKKVISLSRESNPERYLQAFWIGKELLCKISEIKKSLAILERTGRSF